MPRTSKKRGGKTVSRRELIIVGMAIDDNDRIATSVLGNGFYKTQSIRMHKQFGGKMEKGAMFITDSETSLSLFSKNNDLDHIKIPSGHHATNDGKYNINTINGIHSEFKLFLNPFRGISTRHIATYVDWFRANKYLHYHYDREKRLFILHKLLTEKRITRKIGFKNYYKIPYIMQVYRTYKEQKLIYWNNIENTDGIKKQLITRTWPLSRQTLKNGVLNP